jgi:protein involved in polysaccharide export with SLBB domain
LFQPVDVVSLEGEVNFPGIYSLSHKQYRVSDVMGVGGGLTKYANEESVFLVRTTKDGIREQALNRLIRKFNEMGDIDSNVFDPGFRVNKDEMVNLIPLNYKKIKQHPGSMADIVLEPGDRIVVSKRRDLVTVNGRVFNAGVFVFENYADVNYYLESAGGLMNDADKKEIFVVYSNGKSRTTKKYLFFTVYPKIRRDCIVMVPQYQKRVVQRGEKDVIAAMAKVSIMSSILSFFYAIFVK